jgi:hypothetical protein
MAGRVHRLVNLFFNSNDEASLDLLLNLVRRADATDKRDKVYSILGLLNPAISTDIIPDYCLSEQQVYTDLMRSIVIRSERLEQIIFGGVPTKKGWPSWVPDWRLPFERHHIRYLRSRQASGNLPAKIRFLKKGRHGDLLACRGFQVDRVDGIASEPSPRGHPMQSQSTSNRYGSQLSKALQKTLLMEHPGATGELLIEVPWTSRCGIDISSANLNSTSHWLQLSRSNYFEKFHKFRTHNAGFYVGGRQFRSFFPHFSRKNVDISMTLRCMRLALLSLEKRSLITTRTGYLGLAPKAVKPGDVVAILLGSNFPMVLRPYGNNLYHVVGECYIYGLMDGEVLSQESGCYGLQREFVLC